VVGGDEGSPRSSATVVPTVAAGRKGQDVVDWVEFAARMSLAGAIVLPAGMALLWAVRFWSRGGTERALD
jgi:hypothetical protein